MKKILSLIIISCFVAQIFCPLAKVDNYFSFEDNLFAGSKTFISCFVFTMIKVSVDLASNGHFSYLMDSSAKTENAGKKEPIRKNQNVPFYDTFSVRTGLELTRNLRTSNLFKNLNFVPSSMINESLAANILQFPAYQEFLKGFLLLMALFFLLPRGSIDNAIILTYRENITRFV